MPGPVAGGAAGAFTILIDGGCLRREGSLRSQVVGEGGVGVKMKDLVLVLKNACVPLERYDNVHAG